MFAKLLIVALAAAGVCSGTPLEARADIPSAVELENSLLDTQLAYQSVSDHVVFVGNGPPGLARATIQIYKSIVDEAAELPEKPKGHGFGKAVQLALCNAETTTTLQILDAHSLLRTFAPQFSAGQRQKLIDIVKKDRDFVEAYTPAFATYTPVCADSIAHNGRITVETFKVTIQILEAVQ